MSRTVDIGVTGVGGATLAAAYTFDSSLFFTIDQAYSDTLGGSWRLFTGAGFTGALATDIRIDPGGTNTPATAVNVVSDSSMYVRMPAHAAGLVAISIFGNSHPNIIKYWDPTVPGTPTWFGDRGGFSKFTYNADTNQRHWVRRAGSFNVGGVAVDMRANSSIGANEDVDVEGIPYFGMDNGDGTVSSALVPKSITDPPDATKITFDDLMGGSSNAVGGTLLFAGYVERIVSPPSSAFTGDGILYDGGQNRNGLLLDTTPQVKWMAYDGAFHSVTRPISIPGPLAVVAQRDVTTSPGTPFIKITTDGVTWAGDAASSSIGNQSGWDQIIFGRNSGGGSEGFRGLGGMLAFYKIQLTAQDITDFYGWWNAEFKKITFPESDDPTAWFGGKGSGYAGAPFAATESNGLSGARLPLVVPGGGIRVAPTAGAPINGFAPMVFNGSTSSLVYQIVTTVRSVIPVDPGPFTVMVIGKGTAAVAAGTNFQDDPALFTDGNGNMGLVFTSSGVRGGVRTAGVQANTPFIAQATGAYFVTFLRYDAAHVNLRVNTTDAAAVAAVAHDAFAPPFQIGYNAGGAKNFQGEIMEHRTWARSLSTAEMLARYNAIKAKYPAMGLP